MKSVILSGTLYACQIEYDLCPCQVQTQIVSLTCLVFNSMDFLSHLTDLRLSFSVTHDIENREIATNS